MLIFCKENADINKIKEVLLKNDTFSETIYVCFYHNSNDF